MLNENRCKYLTVVSCIILTLSIPKISKANTCGQYINGSYVYDQNCSIPIIIPRQNSSGGSVIVTDLDINTSTVNTPLLMAGGSGEAYQIPLRVHTHMR